jgi:hypothetical protein
MRARLAPAMIAAVPALALTGFGAFTANSSVRAVTVVAGAVAIAVAGLVRGAGRRIEPALWASWGGSPTLQRLRWRTRDAGVVERLHERMRSRLGATLPNAREEVADPLKADQRYEEALTTLRTRTRDRQKFHLVVHENVEYGFRRNSLGIRRYGLGIAVGSCALSLFLSARSEDWRQWLISAVIALFGVIYWAKVVTPGWVRAAAELYADRLLEAIDLLE